MNILLDKEVFDRISEHAEEDYPNECCGFFFGRENDSRKIIHARRVTNISDENQRKRFRISTEDYRGAEAFATEHGVDFLGVYHSHPDHPAEPSEHDRKVAMPFFSYVIVSVSGGKATEIRSWQLNEERKFEEEMIEITRLNKQEIQN